MIGPVPSDPAPSDPRPADDYLHGHVEPVLRSHRWRTAENSAAYLLDRLRPTDRLLDVGCGPGTITIDLARRLPGGEVVGVDASADVVAQAAATVTGEEPHVSFRVADVHALPFEDDAFDVVHAHQVLQHLRDPVVALREMVRVTRPGGTVAVRDGDYGAFTWSPAPDGLARWLERYRSVAVSLGAEPDAGRHLLGWCVAAGQRDVAAGASAWCFATPEDRTWWAGLWSDRIRSDPLHRRLVEDGADDAELDDMVAAWSTWALDPGGWFAVLHGEVLVTVA
jgi:SAM-dependent methyltransferase